MMAIHCNPRHGCAATTRHTEWMSPKFYSRDERVEVVPENWTGC
jgi:hypothetical protein